MAYFCGMTEERRPRMAVLTPDTLAGLGLAGIIERMVPGVDVSLFAHVADLRAAGAEGFVHFFVAAPVLMEDAAFFLARRTHTIVLVHGGEAACLPADFHTLDVCQSEEALVRSVLRLAESAHSRHPQAPGYAGADRALTPLTPRETEVLRLVAAGRTNKEIAARLGVGLTTIISHRKNLTEKLAIKSVSGLTIYAVMHGIIKAEEI